jgi:pyruvate-ferredoxin/flavodoxin oxidoreductase
VFFGLGADGTVGANKNTIKILGEDGDLHAQGYFVYDSKKSGSTTVSHLRFGPRPIRSAYLVRKAHFVGVHQFAFLDRLDVLRDAADDATVLLNSPFGPDRVWSELPRRVQEQILEKRLRLFVIDAAAVARETGLAGRTNTVLQTCFFGISGVLPREQAIERIKAAIVKTYGRKGEAVVRQNFEAVDRTLERLSEVAVPAQVSAARAPRPIVPAEAPPFVRRVTALMMAGRGDELPVSALPADGTWPSGTTRWEKRNIAEFVPAWEPDICIQCGNCALVCPHGVIRAKLFARQELDRAPAGFKSAPIDARGFPDTRYTLQASIEDCTGCALCVEVCPARSKEISGRKAINMVARDAVDGNVAASLAFFASLEVNDRGRVDFSTVRGVQFLEPLFEYSGACAGCGETPYLKLVSQLFGDRMLVANATGCSSIYGGNLPTTPWSVNHEGRGPAWSNSLFEDNAEFGLGMRLAADRRLNEARGILRELVGDIREDWAGDLLDATQRTESEIRTQRLRVAALKTWLAGRDAPAARRLLSVADDLVRRTVWIVGGDGWAYDIGSAGVDHVLASGRDVNVLVLDTEVYSNTGGQASKSTPLGAVAKFANAGKPIGKKDLALQAIAYGNVYVARIAFGANPQQALLALREAEVYPGPSLVIAYSHCIAHGINMQRGLDQQQLAVHSGYWPLLRYNPEVRRQGGGNPFQLDSARPTRRLHDFAGNELRFRLVRQTNPREAETLFRRAQEDVDRRWALYEQMAAES